MVDGGSQLDIKQRVQPILDKVAVEGLRAWLKALDFSVPAQSRAAITDFIVKLIAEGKLVEAALQAALIGFEEASDMRIYLLRLDDDGMQDIKSAKKSLPARLQQFAIRILTARKPAVTNPEALVFAAREDKPFDRHNLSRRQLKSTCKKLGVEGVSWHWLRHTNATLLDAVGTPLGTVQALLGHSSSEITREVYLHSIPADARKAVEKVEELLNRPKLTRVPENWGKGSSLIQ